MSRRKVNQSERTQIRMNHIGTSYSRKFHEIEGLTIQKMFRLNCEKYSSRECLGYRPVIPGTSKRGKYCFITYKTCSEIVTYCL
jgi:hypothetical protein